MRFRLSLLGTELLAVELELRPSAERDPASTGSADVERSDQEGPGFGFRPAPVEVTASP